MNDLKRIEMLDCFRNYSQKLHAPSLKHGTLGKEVIITDLVDYVVSDLEEKLDKRAEKDAQESAARQEKILVCMPNMGTIKNKTVASMIAMDKTENTKWCMIGGSLIYDARDICVDTAIKEDFDYLMFIDSDIEFGSDAMLRLLDRNKDIVTGIYYKRGGDHSPVVYRHIAPLETGTRKVTCETETDVDRPFFKVEGCGMGFCLIKVEVFKKLLEEYPTCFTPIDGLGEDLSFCYRAIKAGYEIWADGEIPLNHWGEIAFGRASWDKEST